MIEVPGDPQVRISNLIDAYRAAPFGADLEVLTAIIGSEHDPRARADALVIKINGIPYPVTLPEAESCAEMIHVTLDLQDLPDRNELLLLAEILRRSVKRHREEDQHGHHHLH